MKKTNLVLVIFALVALISSCKKEDYSADKKQVVWFASQNLNPGLDNNFIIEGYFPTSNGYRMTVDDFHCFYGSVASVGSFRYEHQGAYQKTFQEISWISPGGNSMNVTLEMVTFVDEENLTKFLDCRKEPTVTGEHSFDGIYYDQSSKCLTGINFPNFYRYSMDSYLGGREGTVSYYTGDTLQFPGQLQIPCIYMHTNDLTTFQCLDFQTAYTHPAELIYAYNANPHLVKRVAGY